MSKIYFNRSNTIGSSLKNIDGTDIANAGAFDIDLNLATTSDSLYLLRANNLSDVANTSSAASNLGVYTKTQLETAATGPLAGIKLEANDGSTGYVKLVNEGTPETPIYQLEQGSTL